MKYHIILGLLLIISIVLVVLAMDKNREGFGYGGPAPSSGRCVMNYADLDAQNTAEGNFFSGTVQPLMNQLDPTSQQTLNNAHIAFQTAYTNAKALPLCSSMCVGGTPTPSGQGNAYCLCPANMILEGTGCVESANIVQGYVNQINGFETTLNNIPLQFNTEFPNLCGSNQCGTDQYGHTCGVNNGTCGIGLVCNSGRCMKQACTTKAQCPPIGYECVNGVCNQVE